MFYVDPNFPQKKHCKNIFGKSLICIIDINSGDYESKLIFRKHANKEIDAKGNPLPKQVEKTENMEDNKTSDSKETINCDVCPMKFETVTQAIQHKFRKHPESSLKYYCPFCGMQFPLKVKFNFCC